MPQFLNLVFQGGGIRGIAYVGALQSLPSDVRIRAVGGTSAGALVAGLLALGHSPSDLSLLLQDQELYQLISTSESERFEHISRFVEDCLNCWDDRSGRISRRKLWKVWRSHKSALKLTRAVWEKRGLHGSESLRKWLDKAFEGKCFRDIRTEDLKIVAADVSKQAYLVYSKLSNLNTPIAEAVHASVSIPLFFSPLRLGPRHLVDGGLVSNFPSFLFSQGQYPTIGFRLGEIAAPAEIASTFDYLKALVLTMAEAHDKERPVPQHFKQYWIKTPSDIPSTKFKLSEGEVRKLLEAGAEVGKTVDWHTYSSSKPTIIYYDPKADLTLQNSLQEVTHLADAYSQESLWLDNVAFDMKLYARIERDWTAVYGRDTAISVSGKTPLFFQRFTATADASSASLSDTHFTADEILPGGESKRMISVPMYNKEKEKGFLIFFNSPIYPGETRTLRTSVQIPQEFSQTVAIGNEDEVSFLVRQIAREHTADISFQILLDSELPEIQLQSKFGAELLNRGVVVEQSTGRAYRNYTAHVVASHIHAVTDFTVKLVPR